MPQRCSGGEPHYRRVYVIGELKQNNVLCSGVMCPHEPVERFTIPVPNVPTKAMTKEEAERENGR